MSVAGDSRITASVTEEAGRFESHFAWIDLREMSAEHAVAFAQASLHHGITGIVSDDPQLLAGLPPTVTRVLAATTERPSTGADLVLVEGEASSRCAVDSTARVIEVTDRYSLDLACEHARSSPWTVLRFVDPTKIPLEIVIASANNSRGHTVTIVADLPEAEVVLGCLERGSDGVMLAPREMSDIARLAELVSSGTPTLELHELTVTGAAHAGMGDRACLDTCVLFGEDEGLLVGSFANALVLTCSETHPLPYMPTRPFRVNAAAAHSYVLSSASRTNYLSELAAGAQLLAVRADGATRRVTLGRVKIERRPLLSVDLVGPGGERANIIVQDDWHVRLLGPGAAVRNVTELRPGDRLIGYLPRAARHVGWPIDEFCLER